MISEKMYENHRRQNYLMAERKQYSHKMWLERIDHQKEIITRNCYKVPEGRTNGRKRAD